MKIRTFLLLLLMGSFAFSSCEYEWIEPEKVSVPENVSFAADIMPVFNNGCNTAVCHGPGATPPDLSEANAYNDLINNGYINTETPESSSLYTSMASGSMKPYVQDPNDAELILAWIRQGAKNN